MTLRVAVATKDGISINLHFGHAKMFWVYDVDGTQAQLLETREVDNYCHGHEDSQSAMQKILQTIKDCDVVLSAKIGDGPVEKLARIGVRSVDEFAYLGVEESLQQLQAESV